MPPDENRVVPCAHLAEPGPSGASTQKKSPGTAQPRDRPVVEWQGERIDGGGVQRQPEDGDAVGFEEPDDVRDGPGSNPLCVPDALGEGFDLLAGGVEPWWWQLGQRDRGRRPADVSRVARSWAMRARARAGRRCATWSSPVWSWTTRSASFAAAAKGRAECVPYWCASFDRPDRLTRAVHPAHESGYAWYEADSAWLTGFSWTCGAGARPSGSRSTPTRAGRPLAGRLAGDAGHPGLGAHDISTVTSGLGGAKREHHDLDHLAGLAARDAADGQGDTGQNSRAGVAAPGPADGSVTVPPAAGR